MATNAGTSRGRSGGSSSSSGRSDKGDRSSTNAGTSAGRSQAAANDRAERDRQDSQSSAGDRGSPSSVRSSLGISATNAGTSAGRTNAGAQARADAEDYDRTSSLQGERDSRNPNGYDGPGSGSAPATAPKSRVALAIDQLTAAPSVTPPTSLSPGVMQTMMSLAAPPVGMAMTAVRGLQALGIQGTPPGPQTEGSQRNGGDRTQTASPTSTPRPTAPSTPTDPVPVGDLEAPRSSSSGADAGLGGVAPGAYRAPEAAQVAELKTGADLENENVNGLIRARRRGRRALRIDLNAGQAAAGGTGINVPQG